MRENGVRAVNAKSEIPHCGQLVIRPAYLDTRKNASRHLAENAKMDATQI